MKKNICVLLFMSFTTLVVSQDFRYGVRSAINISNLDFKPDADFDNQHRNGFAFGGFVEYEFNEKRSLLVELQWSAEGGKDKNLRADYIHLPVILRFSLSNRFILGFGPKISLKTWEANDLFATAAFSGIAGAEYMITDELFIDARVSYGVTSVIDQDIKRFEAKNHVIQFGFGMKL